MILDILQNLNTEISEEILFWADVMYTNILNQLNIKNYAGTDMRKGTG